MKRYKVTVTTAADGSATAYSPRLSGEVHQIEYVKDGVNGYTNGVGFTLTGEQTGVSLWAQSAVNASAVVAPRQPTHSQAGAAALYAAGGTAVQARVGLGNDRVKIVLASGGNAKVGVFHIVMAD
jgi:NADPH:quinone reductase-like Zn-dependent oxidoreductase